MPTGGVAVVRTRSVGVKVHGVPALWAAAERERHVDALTVSDEMHGARDRVADGGHEWCVGFDALRAAGSLASGSSARAARRRHATSARAARATAAGTGVRAARAPRRAGLVATGAAARATGARAAGLRTTARATAG